MAFEFSEIAIWMIVKFPCCVIGCAWYWLMLETRQWDEAITCFRLEVPLRKSRVSILIGMQSEYTCLGRKIFNATGSCISPPGNGRSDVAIDFSKSVSIWE